MSDRQSGSSAWKVTSEEIVHDSPWMKLAVAQVAMPDGRIVEHRIVRYPAPSAGVLVHDRAAATVLMIWRERFITGHAGWEIPVGLTNDGEDPREAAIREGVEETGYRASELTKLVEADMSSGLMDERFHAYYSRSWEKVGVGDSAEAESIRWVPVASLCDLVRDGQIQSAHSMLAVLAAVNLRVIDAA